ncbi:MAG: penicillin acylase family protein [Saprospiraceae bacterium]|nr:penicillin acylase family protein [Saprospiraceae bacterium]
MKQLLIPALLFSGWMALLNTDLPVKGNFLPALGRFISPFQGVWQSVTPNETSFDFVGQTKGNVKILFDERDVPHIYADNLEDALYAQGYLHAANRLFSMDVSTRSAAGRLSELIGQRTIAIDRKQRERGFEWSAIQKAKSWENFEGNKAIIDAYVNGVNAYAKSLDYRDWPLEYKILSHAPVEWTSVTTALAQTNMAIALCLGEDDLEYSTAQAKLSQEDYVFLFPDHNPKERPIIPKDRLWDFAVTKAKTDGDQIGTPPNKKQTEDNRNKDLNGSNNWAVSGKKTANGFPLLANDPHLQLALPNIWYEMEIHTPEMSVHGVSIPGLPFIVIGFNEKIAWGSTNSGQDVLDWYQITWQDSSRLRYKLDEKFVDATLRIEEIKVRGAKVIIDTIRYTHWGPVTHTDEHKDMAMKWIGHQKATTNDIDYLKKINKAGDVVAYRDAVSSFQYPAQNKIFASVQGDIAISVAGVMPIRPAGHGESLTSGESTAHDWLGYIPFEHAPFIINPSRGYVSSANQAPADTSYPYPLLGKRIFEDYRGRMVNMLLDTSEHFTPSAMQALQQNNYNLHAADLLPVLLQALDSAGCLSGEGVAIASILSKWNYEYHRDSLSPVFFDLWYKEFENLTWDELDNLGVMRPEEWRMVEIAKDHPQSKYFDQLLTMAKKETFSDIACISFANMLKAYHNLEGDQGKNWGNYKQSAIPHLARFPHFGADFIHTSGGRHIINAMSKTHGPSWRMIVELSSPPKAWVNYPGGQSGNPASPHFRDMLEHYFDGKYYEVAIRNDPAAWTPSRQINISPK